MVATAYAPTVALLQGGQAAETGGHFEPLWPGLIILLPLIGFLINGVLALWQAKEHIGAGVLGEVGSMVWAELASTDVEAAARFYSDILGWEVSKAEMGGDMDYWMAKLDGEDLAGIFQITEEMAGMPSHWSVYWAVEDCDATVEQAKSAGAGVIVEPKDIPPGRFAVLSDPQGAAFSIVALTN